MIIKTFTLTALLFFFSCSKAQKKAPDKSQVEQQVREVIALQYKIPPQQVELSKPLSTYSKEPMHLIEINMRLEHRYKIQIPDDTILLSKEHQEPILNNELTGKDFVNIVEKYKRP